MKSGNSGGPVVLVTGRQPSTVSIYERKRYQADDYRADVCADNGANQFGDGEQTLALRGGSGQLAFCASATRQIGVLVITGSGYVEDCIVILAPIVAGKFNRLRRSRHQRKHRRRLRQR